MILTPEKRKEIRDNILNKATSSLAGIKELIDAIQQETEQTVLSKLNMTDEEMVEMVAEHIYNWKCASLIEYDDDKWKNLADRTREFYRKEARQLLSPIIASHEARRIKAVEQARKEERDRADKILVKMVADLKRARWKDDWGVRGVIYDNFIKPIVDKAREALKGASNE
jgi:predicted metal-dependent hydrolase